MKLQSGLITLIFTFFASVVLQAQDVPSEILIDSLQSKIVEVEPEDMPRFPGCEEIEDPEERKDCAQKKMLYHIYSQLKYPKVARENGIEGMAVARFIVRKTGEITDVEIIRDIGGETGPEIIRVVESMPDWIPGMQRGVPVNVMFTIPVKFKLEGIKKAKKKKKG